MKLYSRLVRNWRNLKRWKNWRKNELHWQELQSRQREIGGLLIKLGDGLTLPGDDDWSEPFTGDDDFQNVKSRV